MVAGGWLVDGENCWVARFYRDEKAWVREPKVFFDYGRGMPDGQPALLKSRRHLSKSEAVALWNALRGSGWVKTSSAWGGLMLISRSAGAWPKKSSLSQGRSTHSFK